MLGEITNVNCTINILHMERSGEQLDCRFCAMECEFKKEVIQNESKKSC